MSSAAALTPLAIPSTLQDSLMARLDRLAPVKEIAQIGGGDRARVLLSPAGSGFADPGAGVAGRARPAHGGRADPRARRAAGGDLRLQARAGAGHGLRLAAAQPAPAHPCRHRAGAGGAVRRPGRSRAGDHRASLHRSGPCRAGGAVLAEGGGTGAIALGARGGRPLRRRRPGADPAPDGRAGPPISRTGAPARPRQRAVAAEGLSLRRKRSRR